MNKKGMKTFGLILFLIFLSPLVLGFGRLIDPVVYGSEIVWDANVDIFPYNLSVSEINRLPFDFRTGIGGSSRFHIGLGGDIEMAGSFDNDGRIIADSLTIRNSRTIPQLVATIENWGITVYDNSAGDNVMINLTTKGNYIGVGNVTINGLFKGKFNWTSADDWNIFDGSILTFNTTKLASINYNATSIETVEGTLDSGDITSIHVPEDGDTYNVSEDVGASPLLIAINFTGVTDFDSIIGRLYYDGGLGHEIQLEIQRSDTGDWENYIDITDTTDFINFYVPVFDPVQHIFPNGDVAVRFDHVQTGIPTHNFFIDFFNLVDGWTSLTVADHDALGGRDNPSNHPWAFASDGSKSATGNWNLNGYNLTNIDWITANYFDGSGANLHSVNESDPFFIAENSSLWAEALNKYNATYDTRTSSHPHQSVQIGEDVNFGDVQAIGDLRLQYFGQGGRYLIIRPDQIVTANRMLTLKLDNADRTITLSGNPTLANWFNQDVRTTASPKFVGLNITGDIIASSINAETLQDVELFKNALVADADPGQAYYVYRNASEGMDYVKIWVDEAKQPSIDGTGQWFFYVNGIWRSALGISGMLVRNDLEVREDLDVWGDVTAGTIQADDGYTGTCINTTFVGGVATGCND